MRTGGTGGTGGRAYGGCGGEERLGRYEEILGTEALQKVGKLVGKIHS